MLNSFQRITVNLQSHPVQQQTPTLAVAGHMGLSQFHARWGNHKGWWRLKRHAGSDQLFVTFLLKQSSCKHTAQHCNQPSNSTASWLGIKRLQARVPAHTTTSLFNPKVVDITDTQYVDSSHDIHTEAERVPCCINVCLNYRPTQVHTHTHTHTQCSEELSSRSKGYMQLWLTSYHALYQELTATKHSPETVS